MRHPWQNATTICTVAQPWKNAIFLAGFLSKVFEKCLSVSFMTFFVESFLSTGFFKRHSPLTVASHKHISRDNRSFLARDFFTNSLILICLLPWPTSSFPRTLWIRHTLSWRRRTTRLEEGSAESFGDLEELQPLDRFRAIWTTASESLRTWPARWSLNTTWIATRWIAGMNEMIWIHQPFRLVQ